MTRLVSLGGTMAAVSTSLDGEARLHAAESPSQRAAADTAGSGTETSRRHSGGAEAEAPDRRIKRVVLAHALTAAG